MRKTAWEIQSGRGAGILKALGEDVRQRATLGPPTERLQAEIAEANEAAKAIIDRAAQAAAADGVATTRYHLFDRMMRAEQRTLAGVPIGTHLLKEVEELENKNYLEADPDEFRSHLRVRVTPLVPDVVVWNLPHISPRIKERRGAGVMKPGDAREDRFTRQNHLWSAPEVGGLLTLRTGVILVDERIEVTGLVSPETGEPQVDLDILARV